MLSLGCRDNGRKGIGLGFRSAEGAMEESELEEGEAFSGHEDDACIDPDIALSYIDEKLQDVLGHFQKDFEGGVSAENLGAKFGGYGSFLPSYQRSPFILSQPRSPPRAPNPAISKSPHNSSTECVRQNPSFPPRALSVSRNSAISLTQSSESSRKENCMSSLSTVDCVSHLDSSNRQVNASDKKSLKVRIKVGPDNTLATSNAAIYSGLGLDSPSTPEDSPGASPRLSPKFQGASRESPSCILQIMTCFSVPGGYLLSPLHDNLFRLSENEILSSRKASFLGSDVPDMNHVRNMALSTRVTKGLAGNKIKANEKNGRSTDEVNLNCMGDTSKMLKEALDDDASASKKGISNSLDMPLQSCSRNADPKIERHAIIGVAKDSTQALDTPKELIKSLGNDKVPLPDSGNDDQYISMGSVKSDGGNVGGGVINYKGKLIYKTTLLEKGIEEKYPSNLKDNLSNGSREGKCKNNKGHDLSKLSGDENKSMSDHIATDPEPAKQISAHKVSSHEKDAERLLQGNDQLHEGKRRQNGSHNNYVPSVRSVHSQGDLTASSLLVQKEEKKSSHARGDRLPKKSKILKSCKDSSRGYSMEPRRDAARNISAQTVENRADIPDAIISTEKLMDRSGVKKDANIQLEPVENAPASTSLVGSVFSADVAIPLDAPLMVIEDNWVCCDRCQKWRLLPYGTNPDHLPSKWKCSMQHWLPGLNKCAVSEEESKEAFNAKYLIPAPVSGANLDGHHIASGVNSTVAGPDHGIPNVPTTGKKMSGFVGASNVPRNSVVCSTEKHRKRKEKHEILGRLSDGGDFVGKSGKHPKSKGKREDNQDGHRASKKIKKEDSDHLVEDRLSDPDLFGRAAPDMDNGLSAKVTRKVFPNCSDHSSSKDSKSEQRDVLSSHSKKSKDPLHSYSNGDFKDHYRGLDVEKSGVLDYSSKKRKVKEEWQENKAHSDTVMNPQKDGGSNVKEARSESELRKQKKAKVSKVEGKESSMSTLDGKTDRRARVTRILLPGNREQRSDGTCEEGRVGGKEQTGYQETRQTFGGNASLKRDMTYVQLPTAATSSSSKVSGSRKSKANLQEAKGSPVESVSSSPLRASTSKKLSIRRNSAAKDDMVNLDSSFMGSPKRCSDGELGSDQSGTLRKEFSIQLKSLESNIAEESRVLGSIGGACHYVEKEQSHFLGGNNKESLYSTRGSLVDLSPADFVGTNSVGDDKSLFDGSQKDNNHDDPGNFNYHRRLNGTSQRKADKSSSGLKERNRSSDSDLNRDKVKLSNPVSDKKESYFTKNGGDYRSESDVIFNGNSDRHQYARDVNCNLQEKGESYGGKKSSSTKRSRFDKKYNHSNNGSEENLDAPNKDLNSKVAFLGTNCEPNLQENIQQAASFPSANLASHSLLDHIDKSEMASRKVTLQPVQPPKVKIVAQNSGQAVRTPIKGSRSDAYPGDTTNKDAFKVAKQSRKPDNQNGVHSSNLRQATPNCHELSPMRKDGPSIANVVLKEARDLKHTANRLKNEGLFQESVGLYFQASLKFLYGAFLLEPFSAESAKHGEMNPSVHMISMYSDTARLCEYCAHEYERNKEMAAAALAYKCVEVAYMKVAYHKHPVANKDRQELLAALQTGESPSSSASDVDNLNNQGTLDKAVLAKAACSPQIAGNHIIAARNRLNFTRLLNYVCVQTNDLNCAFDATKRSHSAIAAASVSLEKDGVDGMSLVREVLDFNFHNVEELLRLIRLSMESISR